MDFIHKYPYSNLHELNLDWLIDLNKDLLSRMQKLEEEMAQIEVMTREEIQAMINSAIETNNLELYNRMTELHNQITQEYTSYVTNRINQLTVYIDNQDIYYNNQAQGYANHALSNANAYTDTKVLNYTMMVNPITGEYEDVRNVVDDIVTYFHTEDSLMAYEYDALDLTAGAYDAYQLTAYDYDFNGKIRLP